YVWKEINRLSYEILCRLELDDEENDLYNGSDGFSNFWGYYDYDDAYEGSDAVRLPTLEELQEQIEGYAPSVAAKWMRFPSDLDYGFTEAEAKEFLDNHGFYAVGCGLCGEYPEQTIEAFREHFATHGT